MKNLKLIQFSLAAMLALGSSSVLAEVVNINKASAQAIAHHLSGIGIKKAEAIVKYRDDNGVFESVDDLTEVKGIGEKLLAKNLADLSLSKGVVAIDASAPKVVKIGSPKKASKVKKADSADSVVTASTNKANTAKVVDDKQNGLLAK